MSCLHLVLLPTGFGIAVFKKGIRRHRFTITVNQNAVLIRSSYVGISSDISGYRV